jgi:hypothetical protein
MLVGRFAQNRYAGHARPRPVRLKNLGCRLKDCSVILSMACLLARRIFGLMVLRGRGGALTMRVAVSLTTTQLRAELPDVPPASLYRHVARLVERRVLSVVAERRVRGAPISTAAARPPGVPSLWPITPTHHQGGDAG